MSCGNEIARMIPWHVAGTLAEQSRAAVDEHLRDCTDCRGQLALAREVVAYAKDHAPESLTEHVNSELLADYAIRPDRLDGEVTRWIEGHLRDCDLCSETLAIVRELPADADAATPWPERVWGFLCSTFLRPAPALAYLFLLVVSFPIYRALLPEPVDAVLSARPPVTGVDGSLRIDFLRGASRNGAATQRIVLPDRHPLVYLGIEPELPEGVSAEDEYRIDILSDGISRWTHHLTAAEIRRSLASDQLALLLAVPASAIPPGSYRLRVLPVVVGEAVLEIAFETGR